MKYIKPLDGLRALAVLLVIVSHWFITNSTVRSLSLGEIGVDIFFVISGFLITSILLKNRVEHVKDSRLQVIRQFIIRRTLRIFPIYYIVIIALFILGSKTGTQIREDFIYYFTYTSNVNFYLSNAWDGMLSHLWSLAVEEQFYLVWPWVIIFTARRYLLTVIVFTVIAGIVFQKTVNGLGWVLTPACFDAFGLGGLLAYDQVYGKGFFRRYATAISILALVLVGLHVFLPGGEVIPLRTVVAVASVSVIFSLHNPRLYLSRAFSNPVLVFLGRISYGLYLYHNIVPWLWENFLRKLALSGIFNYRFSRGALLVQELVVLVVVAWLSWVLIEQKFNNLKKYFSYSKKRSDESETSFEEARGKKEVLA